MKIPKWKNKKILIVEDDEISLEFLTELLLESKAKLLLASDGLEATELCRKHKNIDLILMDVKLPIMSGKEAMLEIRKHNKEIIIIAQTAFAMTGDKESFLRAGFNDYIAKPINVQTLLEKISLFFDKKI